MAIQEQTVIAKDFGLCATSFIIKEEGFVAMIQRRLAQLNIAEQQQEMLNIAKARVSVPSPVAGISRTTLEREFYYDPTYTLLEDIILPNGTILYPAGYQINPLEHMELNRRIIFIDGKDTEQIAWLQQQISIYEAKQEQDGKEKQEILATEIIQNRIVLVRGRPLAVQEKIGEHIYFDQAGELTSKFGIKQVPAIVQQVGKMLKIQEVNIQG